MLIVWGRATSVNVQKVVWAVGEIGVPHERIDVGGRFGGLDSPAYIAMNPHRRVPTIDDDGVVVWESNAIVRYLAARYSKGVLWDEDPGVRAQADEWMDLPVTRGHSGAHIQKHSADTHGP
jgi:glutathione S-transferase